MSFFACGFLPTYTKDLKNQSSLLPAKRQKEEWRWRGKTGGNPVLSLGCQVLEAGFLESLSCGMLGGGERRGDGEGSRQEPGAEPGMPGTGSGVS